MSDKTPKSPEILQARFESLRQLILDTAGNKDLKELFSATIRHSLSPSGVEAGAVSLFSPEGETEWSVFAGDDDCADALAELEDNLLQNLRTAHGIRSLYLTLDQDGPAGVFSYPLKAGATIYGAISGFARGDRNLAVEEEFISAIAGAMALAAERSRPAAEPAAAEDLIRQARATAVAETAVAINHEINNPLTAISGNLQLLLSRATDLSPDVVRLLKKIEEGADRILEVTEKLRNLNVDKTVPYIGDTNMIDLDAAEDDDQQ